MSPIIKLENPHESPTIRMLWSSYNLIRSHHLTIWLSFSTLFIIHIREVEHDYEVWSQTSHFCLLHIYACMLFSCLFWVAVIVKRLRCVAFVDNADCENDDKRRRQLSPVQCSKINRRRRHTRSHAQTRYFELLDNIIFSCIIKCTYFQFFQMFFNFLTIFSWRT